MKNKIIEECEFIKTMLLDKNEKYGNSALEPLRIFCRANKITQLESRIDDKLSRIKTSIVNDTEDACLDLIGYLILLRIAKREYEKELNENDRYKYQYTD